MGVVQVVAKKKKHYFLPDGAPSRNRVQLPNISGLTMVYGRYNYSIHGLYKLTNITEGGPSCSV